MFRRSLSAMLGWQRPIVWLRMTLMARFETIPILGLTNEKVRESMQDASDTLEHSEQTVARVQRQIMRCDALLRRLRFRFERLNKRR